MATQASSRISKPIFGNPTHNSEGDKNDWIGDTIPGNFDFGLGGTFTIDSFVLWNGPGPDSVGNFELLASTDNTFSSPTVLGNFVGALGNPAKFVPAEVLNFTPTSAAYVRMVISSNNGGCPEIGEAAFEVVPLPATATAGLALITLLFLTHRRLNRSAH